MTLNADGQAGGPVSCRSPRFTFLSLLSRLRIIFPQIIIVSSVSINACSYIPFAADGKSDCPVSRCSPEVWLSVSTYWPQGRIPTNHYNSCWHRFRYRYILCCLCRSQLLMNAHHPQSRLSESS